MAQREWDPLRELVGVQDRMNKLFESALARTNFDTEGELGAWTPVADVFETPETYVVSVELPGLVQDDIDVRVEGSDLVVQGERRREKDHPGVQYHRVERSQGKFVRKFPLPSRVDRDGVQAAYRDGVLRVTVPKLEGHESLPIRVSIR